MGDYLALYLRLSKEDMDLHKDALKDESNSIRSQRLLLRSYVDGIPALTNRPVLEFVDDGYTGTNFDRPQFKKMMDLVRTGEVSCILVKDLSRFGRNYLEVGDYLEHLFPFLGVRFIAVNDHYDSNDYVGSTGGLDVAFRNLVYQRYSQDLSAKVKTAKHLRMAQGKHITACPYGYKKKPGIKDKMFVDPNTAPVVREIFLAAIAGRKTTEIAASLNERKILTPMEYKKLSRSDLHNDAMWSHQAVLRIIKDYKYTGAMVTFKCENMTIRAKTQRRRKPEEWVIIEDSHEPIVSHEEYEMANAKIRKGRYHPPGQRDCRDHVYYCGHCGRRLRKTFGLDEYYSCATKMYRKGSICGDVFWSRTDMEEVVLAAYKAQLQLMSAEYRKMTQGQQADPLDECRNKQKSISSELAMSDSKSLHLYEQYRGGIFDKDTFLRKKGELLRRKEELRQEVLRLQAQEETLLQEQGELVARRNALAASDEMLLASDDELRVLMYDAIEKVTVYASREIDITWKWCDVFAGVV